MSLAAQKPERRISALAVSRGIGIGKVVFLHGEKRQFFRIDLDEHQVQPEVERLRAAIGESVDQLRTLSPNNDSKSHQSVSGIFGVHLLIIEESSLVEKIEAVINREKVNAEWALKIVSDQYLEKQRTVADPSFREKYLDIEDVTDRLMGLLCGSPSKAQLEYSGAVVVARELWPSAIMELAKSRPAALITERGGWTSHTSILARELKLPMASGIKNLAQTFEHGDRVIVDGIEGQIILNPEVATVARFRGIVAQNSGNGVSPAEVDEVLKTLDGTQIVIRANVDLPEGYMYAKTLGGGIGLFRSESLIGNLGALPSEDEQFSAYSQIANAVGEDRVKIRTFDVVSHYLTGGQPVEANPSLGLRSIRLSLTEMSGFRTQIRALLRAAADRRIDIVLPMVSGAGEIRRSREILDEEGEKLRQSDIAFGDPKLGAMIEVPSAVLTARQIAQRVDFLCLGTNDLVQYLLAVDRDNDSVAEWYQTLHPAVIRSIGDVIEAAGIAAIPIAMCGEMAGSPFYVPVLIGLGARELSMNVNSISQIRRLVAGITIAETVALVEKIEASETSDETEQILRQYYLENWRGLFSPELLNSRHR